MIAAAVQVLAESGYGRTTFERVRQRAGISGTRLISYHFGTRDELMEAVLTDTALQAQAALARRTEDAPTATERLTARIEAESAWIARNPAAVRAMYEICVNVRTKRARCATAPRHRLSPTSRNWNRSCGPASRAGSSGSSTPP
ncbi:TetR/AcrR family transcriptional regulator [Kitasatospora sp. NPDC050467]|uniref:TetR/AcrR family transcriptional regulator n=1 Tax=Kitasatospora sp. NPDC050467 TaxID=3364053 RepID=UPI0037874107